MYNTKYIDKQTSYNIISVHTSVTGSIMSALVQGFCTKRQGLIFNTLFSISM